MTVADGVFLVASIVAAWSAALVVTRRNPVYGAAWMMVALFAVAVVFLLLHSPFAAVIQVLLYAGAILVLFLFVIMLVNPSPEDLALERPPRVVRLAGLGFAVALGGVLAAAILSSPIGGGLAFSAENAPRPPVEFGEPEWFGRTLYDTYLLAFEMISVLIMVAIAGVVAVAKKDLGAERPAKQARLEAVKRELKMETTAPAHRS